MKFTKHFHILVKPYNTFIKIGRIQRWEILNKLLRIPVSVTDGVKFKPNYRLWIFFYFHVNCQFSFLESILMTFHWKFISSDFYVL